MGLVEESNQPMRWQYSSFICNSQGNFINVIYHRELFPHFFSLISIMSTLEPSIRLDDDQSVLTLHLLSSIYRLHHQTVHPAFQ